MKKILLELFSGTHSVGHVAVKNNYQVVSLDRDLDAESKYYDYTSKNHIKCDIMTWDYKIYPKHHFYLITASPVCLWWSRLRNCWINRKLKGMDRPLTKEDIENDIKNKGEPMVNKIIEIIEYFEPKYYWIENPQTGRMKYYFEEKLKKYNSYNDFDYCMFSDWGYKKRTRFWSNIPNLKNVLCDNNCDNITEVDNGKFKQKIHNIRIGSMQMAKDHRDRLIYVNTKEKRQKYSLEHRTKKKHKNDSAQCPNKYEKYRIPEKLIQHLLDNMTDCQECEECDWKKWYFGRCTGCGNGFNKDEWKDQRARWEDLYPNNDWDQIIDYFNNDGFNHEGNGVCFNCASEYSDNVE
tara:strand:- start:311 stop:1360 length:1050 start_codon:yes stop_codon:yes gene_type:complete